MESNAQMPPLASSSFGEVVKHYMQTHSITYQELCAQLGYRSKTSIMRIVNDETSYALRYRFYQKLLSSRTLSESERKAFEQALKASRTSKVETDVNDAFSMLFYGYSYATASSMQCHLLEGATNSFPLKKFLDNHLANAHHAKALLFEIKDSPPLNTLMAHLVSREITITHLLPQNLSTPEIFRYLASVRSVFFTGSYTPIRYLFTDREARVQNFAFLQYEKENGAQITLVFYPDAEGKLMCTVIRDLDAYRLFMTCIDQSTLQPLKKLLIRDALGKNSLDASPYIQQLKLQHELEAKHYTLHFIGEFPLECIPPYLFRAALLLPLSSGAAKTLLSEQKMGNAYLNANKTMLRFILPQEALAHFFNTGQLGSHPPFLRAFSVNERISILNYLFSTLIENPMPLMRLCNSEKTSLVRFLRIQCFYFPPKASARQNNRHDALLITPAKPTKTSHAAYALLEDLEMVKRFVWYYNDELWPNATLPDGVLRKFLQNTLAALKEVR